MINNCCLVSPLHIITVVSSDTTHHLGVKMDTVQRLEEEALHQWKKTASIIGLSPYSFKRKASSKAQTRHYKHSHTAAPSRPAQSNDARVQSSRQSTLGQAVSRGSKIWVMQRVQQRAPPLKTRATIHLVPTKVFFLWEEGLAGE